MRVGKFSIIFIALTLISCNAEVSSQKAIATTTPGDCRTGGIYVLRLNPPFDFSSIDFENDRQKITVSDGKEAIICDVISEYVASLGEELPPHYKPYVGTLGIKESSHDLYFVVFQHPSGSLNAKLIIRNSFSNPVIVLDYNIHAMYSQEGSRLEKTNLMELFMDKFVPLSVNSIGEYRSRIELNRLYHNGTSNKIESFVFEVDNQNQLDTIKHALYPIGDEVEAMNCTTEEEAFLKGLDPGVDVIPLADKCIHEINFDDDPDLEKMIYFEQEDGRRGLMIFQADGSRNVLGIHQRDIGAEDVENDLFWIETIQVLPRGERIYETIVDSASGDILGIDSTAYHDLIYGGVQFGVAESGGGAVLYWEDGVFQWIPVE